MLATLKQFYPEGVLRSTVLQTNQPSRAIITKIMLGGEQLLVYWNPYTNQIVGSRNREDILMQNVLEWHEELTVGEFGHIFLFLVGLAMLGSVLTGLWYYRKSLLKVFSIGVRSKNSYLFNADLHKLLGVISCLFLLLMGGTGTFFHWEKIERMLGEEGEQAPVVKNEFKPLTLAEINYPIDQLVKTSSEKVGDFVPKIIEYPRNENIISVIGTRPESVRLFGKFNSKVDFEGRSNQLVDIEHLEDGDVELKMEKSFEQLHFGQYGGWFTKILYALGGFCLSVISLTGFMIWLKKR